MGGIFGSSGSGKSQSSQQGPLSKFNVQTSAYGIPVPLLYGRNRIPGNLIWFGDFQAIAQKNEQEGGKGGGGPSSSTTTYTYKGSFAFGLCEGEITGVNYFWKEKDAAKEPTSFSIFTGTADQAAWSHLTSKHPGEALNYRGHAYVAASNYVLLDNASIGNHSFDVTGLLSYDTENDIFGADPKEVIENFLVDPKHGAGFNPSYMGDLTDFSNYCIANNLFISPIFSEQKEARESITEILDLLNSGVFFSDGLLKIVPYSDETVTANSTTFTANVTPVFAFTDDDFLNEDAPIKIERMAPADIYNQVTIQFKDETNSYNVAVVSAQDQSSVELYGLHAREIIIADFVTDRVSAAKMAQLILQRDLATRNNYEFQVGWKYVHLEPCDYVTITDEVMGLDSIPVRILGIEEDEDGYLTITAEDAPTGVSSTVAYGDQAGEGFIVDFNVDPGDVAPPTFFEVPADRALTGLAIGIAVTGTVDTWGGCDVYVSSTGTGYGRMGSVSQPADYGVTQDAITDADDQVVGVALTGIGGQLLGASAQDAENDVTSVLIGEEFAAYTTSTLTAENEYDLTLAERGKNFTTATSHSIGERFVRINEAIEYSSAMNLDMIGKTLYFKFLSKNIYGGARQSLDEVTAYTYTITGEMAKLAPANVTGLSATQFTKGILVNWTNPAATSTIDTIQVWRGTVDETPGTGPADAVLITNVKYPLHAYSDILTADGTTYYYWVRTINKQGYPSAFTSSVTAQGANVGGIEIVNTLPTTENYDGRLALLTTDDILYRHNGTEWISTENEVIIADGSITANKLNVANLAAISADMGDITAGSLNINDLFIVDQAGNATIQSGNFAGELVAASGTFGGSLLAGVLDSSQFEGESHVYDTPGTYSLTIPEDKPDMRILCFGGGGGGGAGSSYADSDSKGGGGGGGGGAGGVSISSFENVVAGTVLTINVGAGGAGGVRPSLVYTGDGGNGTAGEDTSVTGLVSASGGARGTGGDWRVGTSNTWAVGGSGGTGGSGTDTPGNNGSSGQNGYTGTFDYNDLDYDHFGGAGGSGGSGVSKGGDGGKGGEFLMPGSGNSQTVFAKNGSAGQNGKVVIEFFKGNSVVIQSEFQILLNALNAQGIDTE